MAATLDFMWGYVMGQRSATDAAVYARSADTAGSMASHRRLIDGDERIDRLLLLVEAMWSLLEEHGFSDKDLAARLIELDQSDGNLDERRMPSPSTCRSCGSKVAAGLAACQFCGTALSSDTTPPSTRCEGSRQEPVSRPRAQGRERNNDADRRPRRVATRSECWEASSLCSTPDSSM